MSISEATRSESRVKRPPVLFAEWLVVLNGCVPLVMLMYDARYRQLGSDPIRNALQITGAMSLGMLIATLCITPLQRLIKLRGLVTCRRPLGMMSFLYGAAHAAIYVGYDRGWDAANAVSEISTRNYLRAGAFTLLLMLPLVLTSSTNMMRSLGFRRWKLLHRAVYPAAIAGASHFGMQSKANFWMQVFCWIALVAWLAFRLASYRGFKRSRAIGQSHATEAPLR